MSSRTKVATRGSRSLVTRGRAAVATLLVGSMAACAGGGDRDFGVAAGEAPTEITMDLRNDVDTFDPMLTAADQGAVQMYEAIYDTLVRRDIESGEYIPAMAESWEVTPTRVDFQLKETLTCADGTELTADDVAASIERLADPETGSVYTGRLFGSGGVASIESDEQARTVSVEVEDPHTDLLDGFRNAFIVCPEGLADVEALATEPQGTGPYRITSMSRGDTYVLERWDSPAVEDLAELPEKITMKVVTADSTRANLYETGASDIAAILGRDANRLASDAEPIKGKAYQADSLMFNQRDGYPLADENLRRAIALAVDAQEYTQAASFGVGEPADTVITSNMDCYTPENAEIGLKHDPAAAAAALEEAGYGPGGEQLTLRLVGYDVQNSGPDYIADALRKLGIEVEVTNGTQAQAAGIVYGDQEPWDLVVFPFLSAAPHPYPLVTKMSSNLGEGGAYNFGRVRNPDFDRLADQAPGATGDERCRLWGEAEAALLERTDLKPLLWPVADYFANGLTFQTEYRTIDLRTIRTEG